MKKLDGSPLRYGREDQIYCLSFEVGIEINLHVLNDFHEAAIVIPTIASLCLDLLQVPWF